MRRLRSTLLLLLCALPAGVLARPDIFMNREWEPDFRVLRGTRLAGEAADGHPAERQVFTCLLSLADLQFRRCDVPAPPSEPQPDSASAAGATGAAGCYRAEYEISLEVFSGKGRRRVSQASRYHHDVLTLESSRLAGLSPRRWTHFTVDLPPGRYTWWAELQDLGSRRQVRREGEFEVLDLAREERALSGLWLLTDADSLDPDPLAAEPFLEERGGRHAEELVVYYEVWSRAAADLELSSLILDRRDRARHRRSIVRSFPAGVSRNLLRVPLGELGGGDYLVELTLAAPRAADERPGRGPRPRSWRDRDLLRDQDGACRRWNRFTVRWRGEPVNPSDLDRAVEQLRYLLPARRFRELQESPVSRRKALFDEFWASVDPSPDTEANELMSEYYRRAEFADRRFSWSRFAGWRSDRGRIYMIYGDPDEVERQDGDMDHPAWERWIYAEGGREFLFVDRQGFGDYQLVLNPDN